MAPSAKPATTRTKREPEVVVFDGGSTATRNPTDNKFAYKSFMSAKVSKINAKPPPPKSEKEQKEDEEGRQHDRQLAELLEGRSMIDKLHESQLSGKERHKNNTQKLAKLGMKIKHKEKMPTDMFFNSEKARAGRAAKALQDVTERGLLTATVKRDIEMLHMGKTSEKKRERKPVDRGLMANTGRLKDGMLHISKKHIDRVNGTAAGGSGFSHSFDEKDKPPYSFLESDPYPLPAELPARACERKDSVATVTTIRFNEPEKSTTATMSASQDLNLKASQATLTEGPAAPAAMHEPAPITRVRLLAVMCALSLAAFLSMLDQSILSSALPAITNQFGELSSIAWVSAAYMLTFTALQPILSKISEIVGRLPVLLVSLGFFSSGSAICGAAANMNMLIAGRAIAGCGGCGISTMVQLILIDMLPLRERSTYMSFMSMASTAAVVSGPIIGGAITDHWVWRWCFYLNLPICAVIAAISFLAVGNKATTGTAKEKLARIDFAGAFTLMAGLVLFILSLNWGGKTYPWRSAAVIVTLTLSFLLFIAFVYIETKVAREPIITMRMFTSRTLTPVLLSQFFLGAGVIFTVLYLSVYFTVVHNASSTKAGLYLLPYFIGMMVSALFMGPLVTRFDMYRPFIWVGLAIMAISAALLNIINHDTKLIVVLVLIGLFGIGSGVGIMPLMVATQASCDNPRDVGTASILSLLLRNLGSIVGIAIVGSIFNNSLVNSMTKTAAQFPEYTTQIFGSLNDATVAWSSSLPADVHYQIIEGYVRALKATFIANAPFVGIAFALTLLMKHRSLGKRAPPASQKPSGELKPSDNASKV
ncbi:hypothetical protein GGI19_000495 [Coemansia pectinata]|uniref:Major facilitator superfamily (MFS) profile domain-containing protein n=1 Tax=Coemansia pectinata TaxID=1052879 RepID=A0A9W8H3J3_9FUNG|nr:hypothetical protein GGI19_000495 [Coemansia pectinata]